MTLRLFALSLSLLSTLALAACGDDTPTLTDSGADTGTPDTGPADTGTPPDTSTDACVSGRLCTPSVECQEGRTTCDPDGCEATGAAPADTECTGGTCDGLGTCVRTEDEMWTASDEDMFDAFGGDIAIDGDYAVIGVGSASAGVYADAAYVFEQDSGGNWAEQAILDTDDVTGGQFGVAVDVSGDAIVVGTPGASIDMMNDGVVYVFRRDMDGAWNEVQRLRSSDPTRGQRFGRAVAIDGGRIAVGAFTSGMVKPMDPGKVYVFESDAGGTFTEAARLVASDGREGDGLGWSVDIEGDLVVAGAPMDNNERGSVYVYSRAMSGAWSESERLEATEGAMGDELGAEVILRGTTLIASAPLSDEMGVGNAGAVYVFTEQADSSFDQTGRLVAGDGAAEDLFGSIALDGDTLLVGASGYDRVGRSDMGIVYVFDRAGETFTESEQIYRAAPEVGDRFGAAVAVSGTVALVGGPGVDVMSNEDAGAVFLFSPLPRP